jgi:endonuclease III
VVRPNPGIVERRLRQLYGQPRHHNKRDPLAELVFILLSTQTREGEYRRTFAVLWKAHRSWDRVRRADPAELEDLIRFGGFARRKVALLQKLLERVRADHGKTSLRWLATLSTRDVLAYLVTLPGVGRKTARCVAMYALERPVLAVDTHVWRIAQRLGWVDGGKHPDDRRSDLLEKGIPPALRYSLHVTMVAHGRLVCRARPACGACALYDLCPRIGLEVESELRSAAPPCAGVRRVIADQGEELRRDRLNGLGSRHRRAIRRQQMERLPEWPQPEELVADRPREDLREE